MIFWLEEFETGKSNFKVLEIRKSRIVNYFGSLSEKLEFCFHAKLVNYKYYYLKKEYLSIIF